jgi:hypothetical protein
MIKRVTKYSTEDGQQFGTVKEAIAHSSDIIQKLLYETLDARLNGTTKKNIYHVTEDLSKDVLFLSALKNTLYKFFPTYEDEDEDEDKDIDNLKGELRK